ncbi:Oidioi.mRNA.OKI2018_I69.chr1.g722.t1.cds [Oikopleura dioica]|uniref:Oidioi.mRNA.OKI2018_I69.chr1.g722.t1.cds n=1 Tax=Oikopleura dioica TaxID=34765 RepID=A0ABN7SKQ2_OIKDI|nr:Oidioi.mRNA.OKI2018_I69.chr1.g722.t1.cds [Oikopleura dioica]
MKISSFLFLFDFCHGKLDMGSEGRGSVTGSAKPQMNQKGKISQLIENEKDWEELQAKDVPLVVGYFENFNSNTARTYIEAMRKITSEKKIDWLFGHCIDKKQVAEIGNEKIIAYKPLSFESDFEPQAASFDHNSGLTGDSLYKFAVRNVYGLVPRVTKENMAIFPKLIVQVLKPDEDVGIARALLANVRKAGYQIAFGSLSDDFVKETFIVAGYWEVLRGQRPYKLNSLDEIEDAKKKNDAKTEL